MANQIEHCFLCGSAITINDSFESINGQLLCEDCDRANDGGLEQ